MKCQSRLIFIWKGKRLLSLELSTHELVDDALGINHAQGFDLNVDLHSFVHSLDVDDVAPPTVKLSDAKRHASFLSNFLLDNSLYLGLNEINSFQKLVGIFDKMILVANLSRQHQRSLNSYFKTS
jgi:hypothetical protein